MTERRSLAVPTLVSDVLHSVYSTVLVSRTNATNVLVDGSREQLLGGGFIKASVERVGQVGRKEG